MNYKNWATAFALMLLAETVCLAHVRTELDRISAVPAIVSPVEEHCVVALDRCNFINETRRDR